MKTSQKTSQTASPALRHELLAWYDQHRRDLPWRESNDPYRIWISEIMLQQTRVSVVLPYWKAFLKKFPNVETLAGAPLDDVLAAWSGLGYYRRARQLHKAAGEIVERGGFPRTARELKELSGFGPYTSGAVASIAFGEHVAALDGNLERVLCRLHGIAEDPKRSATRRILDALALEILNPERPGDGNQALMDIGSQICTPRDPTCESCPLAFGCTAHAQGEPQTYPLPKKRRKSERVRWLTLQVEKGDTLVFFRRPESSKILPGMWELPTIAAPKALRDAESELAATYGGEWTIGKKLGEVRHSITYRAITIEIRRAEWKGTPQREMRRRRRDDLGDLGLSSLFEKALRQTG